MAKITVHMPKLESPKMDNMFVVVPNMEVNFPTDFKIKSTILAVKSRKAPSHVTVSSPVSLPKCKTRPYN